MESSYAWENLCTNPSCVLIVPVLESGIRPRNQFYRKAKNTFIEIGCDNWNNLGKSCCAWPSPPPLPPPPGVKGNTKFWLLHFWQPQLLLFNAVVVCLWSVSLFLHLLLDLHRVLFAFSSYWICLLWNRITWHAFSFL